MEYGFGLLVGAYPGAAGKTPCKPASAPRVSSVLSAVRAAAACEIPASTGRMACTHEGNSPGAIASAFVIGEGMDSGGAASSTTESQSGNSVKSESVSETGWTSPVEAGGTVG